MLLHASGFGGARATELLEREREELAFGEGQAAIAVRPFGFAGRVLAGCYA